MKTVLITGVAGMIGFQLAQRMMEQNYRVIGIDFEVKDNTHTFNSLRFHVLQNHFNFSYYDLDLNNTDAIEEVLHHHQVEAVYHLAALAGVKFSHEHPARVMHNNQDCFVNILEAVKRYNNKTPVLFASSSSIYGGSTEEKMNEATAFNPKSFYALSKIQNEQTAELYAHSFDMKICAFRFFTVYGEYNRKDMFIYKCLQSIEQGQPLTLYHNGLMRRDFVYVQDIAHILVQMLEVINSAKWNFQAFNLGGGRPVSIAYVVELLETYLGKKANIILDTAHPSYDPVVTYCDNTKISSVLKLDFTTIEVGLEKTIQWFNRLK